MARSLTTAVSDEMAADALRPAIFVKAEFDSGDLNLWTGDRTIVFDGDTYYGANGVIGIEPIKETQKLQANGLTYTLNGVDSAIISIALNEEYQWRSITTWFAVLDEDFQIIPDPLKIFAGKMDVIGMSDKGESATISLDAENNLIGLKDSKERRYTHEDQIAIFAGDLGLEFMPTNSDVEITWGASSK